MSRKIVEPARMKLTLTEKAFHDAQMKLTDDLCKMVDQRIAFATKVKIEHAKLSAILETALGDLRSVLPALIRQANAIEADTRVLVQKAIDAGEDDIAAEASRSLATWSQAPWKKTA